MLQILVQVCCRCATWASNPFNIHLTKNKKPFLEPSTISIHYFHKSWLDIEGVVWSERNLRIYYTLKELYC